MSLLRTTRLVAVLDRERCGWRMVVGILVTPVLAVSAGCTAPSAGRAGGEAPGPAASGSTPLTPATVSPATPQEPASSPDELIAGDGQPRRAILSIPALGLEDLPVIPYVGSTDDAPGTTIQDRGVAASPVGPRGGVGAAGIGNYQVTAHRTSSSAAFELLPDLRRGDRVEATAGGATYRYRIVRTRSTSFRSDASLRAQRAAVRGRPWAAATRAMITLSTCATREDHAAGNYWSDQLHNPEHRIDKVGVLVATHAT